MVDRARNAPAGPIVEVGVYKGGTAWHLWQLCCEVSRELWLYDTFAGTPYQGELDHHRTGDFADCSFDEVKALMPHAHIIQGIFPGSAVGGARFFPTDPVAFVHLDCDQERSYREAIKFLMPRMALGGIMWFDDAPFFAGAKRAVQKYWPRPFEDSGKWWVRL